MKFLKLSIEYFKASKNIQQSTFNAQF